MEMKADVEVEMKMTLVGGLWNIYFTRLEGKDLSLGIIKLLVMDLIIIVRVFMHVNLPRTVKSHNMVFPSEPNYDMKEAYWFC